MGGGSKIKLREFKKIIQVQKQTASQVSKAYESEFKTADSANEEISLRFFSFFLFSKFF